MNVMMVLERVERGENKNVKAEEATKLTTKITDEHDPLRNARILKLMSLCTSFDAFDDDTDADVEDEPESDDTAYTRMLAIETVKHRPNKRQRMRRRTLQAAKIHNDFTNDNIDIHNPCTHMTCDNCGTFAHYTAYVNGDDEQLRDAAAEGSTGEADWIEVEQHVQSNQATQHRTTPPGHITDYMRHVRNICRASWQRKQAMRQSAQQRALHNHNHDDDMVGRHIVIDDIRAPKFDTLRSGDK